ncbi:MAG: carbohydrate kinase family protein [Candidatus Asgardarchaeia archaeon]
MSDLDIVCVGAAAVDIVAIVEQIPRVDDIVLAERVEKHAGGSTANVSVGLARLGLSVGFVGKLVNDEYGNFLLEDFKRNNIDTTHVIIENKGHTASCFIVVDKKGQRIIVALGGTAIINNAKELNLDYFKVPLVYIGESLPAIALNITNYVHDNGGRVVYAPGGLFVKSGVQYLEPILTHADFLLFSKTEILTLTNTKNVWSGIKELKKLSNGKIVVTLGRNGVMYWDGNTVYRTTAFEVKHICDTTGAGDAFTAGFLFGLLKLKDPLQAIEVGEAVAAIKIQHYGARGGLPSWETVEQFLKKNHIDIVKLDLK